MLYQHLIDHCLDTASPHRVERAQVDGYVSGLAPAIAALADRSNKDAAPMLDIAFEERDLQEISALAAEIRRKFRHVVIAGTGGSGLSGRTLTDFMQQPAGLAFDYLENIDPDRMDSLLDRLDLRHTCFLVISKSGTTVETLSQFYVLLDYVRASLGRDGVRERFVLITMPGSSPMRDAAAEHDLRVLDHDPGIGGRFAILTAVGLLPAAIAGIDIRALRRGAQSVVAELAGEAPATAVGAALQYAFIRKGYPLSVMLPYSERLSGFSAWYRQSWAESLGKQGRGSTPIRAVGTTDQHSQLQLYLDGPKDKLFHMITLDWKGRGRAINAPARADLDYLAGKTMGDVMAAEQKATLETLVHNDCPVRVFKLSVLSEEQMGALLMHFMLEILLISELLQVNPFDQPAVEEGKALARDYLLLGNI
jgi:glucose-6-phosphate isomerase